MTITQMVHHQQQQRIGELAQKKQQGKPHVNPYGTPGMSLNNAGDYRKMVHVDEGVVRQVKQIAFDHMKMLIYTFNRTRATCVKIRKKEKRK